MLRKALACIPLAVALAFVAVPAQLMGSTTYFFISQNPDWSDSAAAMAETPIWHATIIEMESDSLPSAPDSFVTTDIDEIHGLGLLTPSETREATERWEDYHNDGCGRAWTSWLLPGYAWINNEQYRTMYVCSATYRTQNYGYCYVRGQCYLNGINKIMDKHQGGWPVNAVAVGASFAHKLSYPWTWDEYGFHDWGTPPTKNSHKYGVW